MSERVAVVGSRAHPKLELVREYIRSLPAGTVVISGGAEGVDRAAEDEVKRLADAQDRECDEWSANKYASERHAWPARLLLRVFDPCNVDARDFGRPIDERDRLLCRNTLIALDCTRMVVFPDGSKGGCWDAAREAQRFRRPVEVRYADGRVIQAAADAALGRGRWEP